MAAAIKKRYGIKPELIGGGGGIFDVRADGEMIYSKFESYRFPQHDEIFGLLDAL